MTHPAAPSQGMPLTCDVLMPKFAATIQGSGAKLLPPFGVATYDATAAGYEDAVVDRSLCSRTYRPVGSSRTGRCRLARLRQRLQRGPLPDETIQERGEVSQDDLRVNDRIRISPIRLIDQHGEQVGVIPADEARELALDAGLDLVEVAPNSRPPVCRIMDFGKYKYEQARKAKEAKKKQHTITVKEIKLRPKIEEHDYGFKMRHARRFLEEGDKVKFTLRFRGREMTHPELGERVLAKIKAELGESIVVEADIRREGRTMTMLVAPRTS